MRKALVSSALGAGRMNIVLSAFAAVLLAGCSDSIERFSQNYNNPSDQDPVYTASAPQAAKPMLRRVLPVHPYQSQVAEAPIVETPIYKTKPPVYDYSKSYKQAYAKPVVQAPQIIRQTPALKINAPAQPTQLAMAAPKYQPPAYKPPKLAYNAVQPEIASADPIYDNPRNDAGAAETPVQTKPTYRLKAGAAAVKNITVTDGMTLYGIARANHMTVQQLALANGLKAPYGVPPGRILRIPAGNDVASPQLAANESKPETKAVLSPKTVTGTKSGTHTVASGDTLYSLGRVYKVSPFAIADLNSLPHNKALTLGQQLRIPGGAKTDPSQQAAVPKEDGAKQDVADNATPSAKPPVLAMPKANAPSVSENTQAPADPAQLAMRWPLRGKVISGYGNKPNGLKNEGINIAVPEGTNIQAAEGGVVAYAGNELKGYGNLVLIRHDGGFVTAYAHASQLLVKKGDQVKRGTVIAKAGQTGAVQSPQLHFEVRKGATALDPMKYLSSSTAMN